LPTDFQELSFTSPQTTAGAAAFTAYFLLVFCLFATYCVATGIAGLPYFPGSE
jgi:hypothetical protein